MREFKKTFLYVKTHTQTGLKYFGKTTLDPNVYTGSGKYWKRHLKIHGADVSTTIIGEFLEHGKCLAAALQFSVENNIVASHDWANLKNEELDGGWQHINSNVEFRKIKNSKAGKACWAKHPDIVRVNLSKGWTHAAVAKGVITKKQKYGSDYFKQLGSTPKSDKHKASLAKAQLGKKLMNNGLTATFISEDRIQEFLTAGWKFGRK